MQQQQQQQHAGNTGGHHHHHHHHGHSAQQPQQHSQLQAVGQSSGSRQQAAAAAAVAIQQSQRAPGALAGASNAASMAGGPPPPSQQQQQQQQHPHHHHHHHHASQQASQPPAPQLHPIPSVAGVGGSSSHHHHHHHHNSSNGHGQQRSKKDLQFLAGLPSQDRESYYDSGPSGVYGSDDADDVEYSTGLGSGRYEHGDASADFEGDCSSHSIAPKLSNRGNKLVPGAQHVKKGRLGGWENHEIFTSRSAFPSNNNYPSSHTTNKLASLSGLPGASGSRPRQGGAMGFTVTPNLSLVPTSSTAAARPDRDIHISSSVPSGATGVGAGAGAGAAIGPDGLSVGGAALPDYPSKKRRKIQTSHTGLASTSGPSANYTSCPVRAYLPIPPQNPIELVSSPLVSRTFNPKDKTLEKLSLSATELIEQDMELLRALTRLVDLLRGNSIAGLQGIVGLPFSGDDGQAPEREEREREREQGQTSAMRGTDATAAGPDATQQETGQALPAHPAEGPATEAEAPQQPESEGTAMQVDKAFAQADEGGKPESALQDGAGQAAPTPSNGVPPANTTNGRTSLENGSGINGAGGKGVTDGNGDRDSGVETGALAEQEEEDATTKDTAPLAPALQRIAYPYPYIESLFG